MKQQLPIVRYLFWALITTLTTTNNALITTLNYADPQPLYTAHYPYSFLAYAHKNYLEGISKTPWHDAINVSFMPFFQRANYGTNFLGQTNFLTSAPTISSTSSVPYGVPIGNIPGRINLLAILPYNQLPSDQNCSTSYTNTCSDIPCCQQPPQTYIDVRNQLLFDICKVFTNPASTPTQLENIQGLLQVQQSNDTYALNMGIFSNKMQYRKYGVRFNLEAMIAKGLGVMFSTGIATLTQTPNLIDQTQNAQTPTFNPTTPTVTAEQWKAVLGYISVDAMSKVKELAQAANLNICTYDRTSLEDLYLDFFWRGIYQVQRNRQRIPGLGYQRWDSYLAIPFASVGATIATGKENNPNILFSLPFSNNGHNALRVRAGLCLDFLNSVEFCGEVGFTHFEGRNVRNLRIPTNQYQMIFYPFGTDALVKPGNNWHLSIGTYAYNFTSTVSASFLYVFIHHAQDKISICQPVKGLCAEQCCSENAFDVEALMCRSAWLAHVINGSLSCEISPHARLLGVVQIPLARKNAYKSTTYGLSFEFGY